MVGHRVTNPQMFGVAVPGKLGGGGELAESAELFEQNVVRPNRRIVEETVQTLLRAAGLDSAVLELSSQEDEVNLDASWEHLDALGEDISDDWELIDESPVDYETEAVKDALWAFASVPSSNPNGKSEQDTEIIKVRYVYSPKSVQDDSRSFCKKMVAASKVYRKEDIEAASLRAVNPGLGKGGSNTYDLFLYKGGARCHHFWSRQTYLKKTNKKISVNQAKKLIREAGVDAKRLPTNSPKVAQRPIDMPNEGFVNPR